MNPAGLPLSVRCTPQGSFGDQVFEEAGHFNCTLGKALWPVLCAPEEMICGCGCRHALFLPEKQNVTISLLHQL